MKTNKSIMLGMVAMFAMAIFASSMVFAEDNSTNTTLVSENVTEPSASSFFWKNLGLFFTFNQEKKMNKELELAQMRLQQAEAASQKNNSAKAEKALDEYNRLMDSASKRAEMLNSGSNINGSTLRVAAMEQAILVHEDRIAKIQARLNNENLTDDQRAKIQERLDKAENVTAHLQDVQTAKEEKIKTRMMAELNMTSEQADAKIQEAKDNSTAIMSQYKDEWKAFKQEAKDNNMTPGQYAKEKRQEWRQTLPQKHGREDGKRPKPLNQSEQQENQSEQQESNESD